jgi:hypothetical protein
MLRRRANALMATVPAKGLRLLDLCQPNIDRHHSRLKYVRHLEA